MAKVAVIIVAWNSSQLIEGVLKALERQTFRPTRILLLDNGSDDAASLKFVADKFPACELWLLGENKGFAQANNIAIKQCSDMDFVALLNPDAFPEANWLEKLIDAAKRYPDASAFASRLINYAHPHLLDGAGDYLTISGKPGRRGHGYQERGRFLEGEYIFSPCAAAALYRYEPLVSVGGFDNRFFCYVEDVDLGFRMLLAGYRSRYVPESLARHVGSAVTGRRSDFSVYYGQRNLVFNYVKNMPLVLFIVFLIPHLLLNLIYLIGGFLSGSGIAMWNAKRDALKLVPDLWRERHAIQSKRKVSSITVLRALKFSLW